MLRCMVAIFATFCLVSGAQAKEECIRSERMTCIPEPPPTCPTNSKGRCIESKPVKSTPVTSSSKKTTTPPAKGSERVTVTVEDNPSPILGSNKKVYVTCQAYCQGKVKITGMNNTVVVNDPNCQCIPKQNLSVQAGQCMLDKCLSGKGMLGGLVPDVGKLVGGKRSAGSVQAGNNVNGFDNSASKTGRANGIGNSASGKNSLSNGIKNDVSGSGSVGNGIKNNVSGKKSVGNGISNDVSSDNAVGNGICETVKKNNSISNGIGNQTLRKEGDNPAKEGGSVTNGICNTTMGNNTLVNGIGNFAGGDGSVVNGINNFDIGGKAFINGIGNIVTVVGAKVNGIFNESRKDASPSNGIGIKK